MSFGKDVTFLLLLFSAIFMLVIDRGCHSLAGELVKRPIVNSSVFTLKNTCVLFI